MVTKIDYYHFLLSLCMYKDFFSEKDPSVTINMAHKGKNCQKCVKSASWTIFDVPVVPNDNYK